MIKFGPAGIPTTCSTTEEGLREVHRLGLEAMEIEFVRSVYLSEKKAREIKDLAKELGIELSVHAPYYINLASTDPEKVKASKTRILKSAKIASLMGAEIVVVHAGYYGKNREEAEKAIFSACREISEFVKKRGWNVVIGLETTGRVSQWGTLEEVVDLCSEICGCAPVIDFAHIYARNGGRIDYRSVFETVSKLNPEKLHSHFSGITFTIKGERSHIPINSRPSFEELAKELLKRKLEITIISESPLLERDALKMKKILNRLKN
ncbi:MAG: TIM barrel protein [Candidatus Micrarchaeota archaeon]|nr:TIM barrel protein [Candidatus Micrarchaeota archaeon]